MVMKRNSILFVVFAVLLVVAGGVSLYLYRKSVTRAVVSVPSDSQPVTQTSHTPAPVLYYPMTNFGSRITVRSFGQLVNSTDVVSPCGALFSGYHDAEDLEVTSLEVGLDVPVYAIADGIVREFGPVSGYGGLLVLGVTINGQNYTVYYGHINLGSATLEVGESVKAGQKLASLGAQCSTQTSGERKHLHFAMHVGTAIDVRGYVPTASELAAWIDPKAFLAINLASIIQ